MKNNIQKTIDVSNAEAEKAFEKYNLFIGFNNLESARVWRDFYIAFSEHAAKLTLLLNSGSESSGKKDGVHGGKPV